MLMNGGAGVNYGNALRGNRRTAQPSPAEELDVGNVDVDALLADSAHQDRAWTQKLQGLQAQQALNALQKWMFEHDSPNDDRERWRRAYYVMTKLASNCDELPKQLSIDWVGFTEDDKIGRGSFADVYKGVDRGRLPVAVKRLHFGDSGDREHADLVRRFHREALIWFQLRHPSILPLNGIYKQNANVMFYPCMISPWVNGGTITQYIRQSEYKPELKRIPLLIDVVKGLDYVHERGVYHGDFHDGNILIHDGRALLTDFGMTVVGDKSNSRIPTTKLTANAIRWIAPELLSEGEYVPRKTWEGDMFGFGRLCVAICTKGVLFPRMSETQVTLALYDKQNPERPKLAECDGLEMSDQLWNLASDCWKEDTSSRPRAAEGLRRLVAHS